MKMGYELVSEPGNINEMMHPSPEDLQAAAAPLLEILNKYYDPHHYAVVTEGYVQILGGQMGAQLPVRD